MQKYANKKRHSIQIVNISDNQYIWSKENNNMNMSRNLSFNYKHEH